MIPFGPIPSRRLGRSLGVNNIPPKVCTYSCVYCQVGRTLEMAADRRSFYDPNQIFREVRDKVREIQEAGDAADYLTFVPDGEPTLDVNLGQEIDLLKQIGIKIAVITNSSLLGRDDVRNDLLKADWVSVKVDSTVEEVWRKVNHPHRSLHLPSILDGILAFAGQFEGDLMTETMLVEGVNDSEAHIRSVAAFLERVRPATAYLSIPTRPPADEGVRPPSEQVINRAYQILSKRIAQVEYLIGYEGNAFASTGDIEEDLLSITAVHPMREEAVREFVTRAGADWTAVQGLVGDGRLAEVEYGGYTFYTRRLRGIGRGYESGRV